MNKFKLTEITAIGNALEQLQIALQAAKDEGNDYCEAHLEITITEARIALDYAESCGRGED